MSDEHDYHEEDKTAQEEFIDKPRRRAALIAIALFSLMYDLTNGVVFEESTVKLAEEFGVNLDMSTSGEIGVLFGVWMEATK